MKSLLLFAVAFCLYTPAIAQDSCKSFTQRNPHFADMYIYSVSVTDPDIFSVTPDYELPYFEKADSDFKFTVCIKKRDGKKYSTQVRYESEHGTISYNVKDFVAPNSADVLTDDPVALCIYPNPVSSVLRVRSDQLASAYRITNMHGISVQDGQLNGSISVERLSPGSYHLELLQNGDVLSRSQFVVSR